MERRTERAGVSEREGGRPIGWEAIRVGRLGRCRQGLFPHVRIRKTVSSLDRSLAAEGAQISVSIGASERAPGLGGRISLQSHSS